MNKEQNWGDFYTKRKINIGRFLNNLASHKELFESILKDSPRKILEVGSGSGAMCTFLSWLGLDVVSIDNDNKVLVDSENFTKSWNGKCEYKFADAFNLHSYFGVDEFDISFSQGFFEHYSDEQIVHLIDEQLIVSKTVLFSVPSYYYRRLDFGNERLMREDDWRGILSKYKNISIKYYHPKLRGIKVLIMDLVTQPWRLFPWVQPEHLLIEIKK